MSLTIKFENGPRDNESLYIEGNQSIGRKGDIILDHPKISGIHAFFEISADKKWSIKDDDSKNGVFINGEKISESVIQKGDLISLGNIELKVIEIAIPWRSLVEKLISKAKPIVKNEPLKHYAFRKLPLLQITQGIQTGEQYLLEYGPRKFGGETQDIILFEPMCPDIAFEIHSHINGTEFVTNYPDVVLVNQKRLTSKILEKGDSISIRDTLIEIDFVNL